VIVARTLVPLLYFVNQTSTGSLANVWPLIWVAESGNKIIFCCFTVYIEVDTDMHNEVPYRHDYSRNAVNMTLSNNQSINDNVI
jgi:hypothetical protein